MTLMSGVVKTINKITKGLKFQTLVTHKRFVTDAGKGDPSYVSKTYSVVVEYKERQVRSFAGEIAVSHATVTFIQKLDVGEHDLIVLADGSGGPVVGATSPADASGKLITEAYLG